MDRSTLTTAIPFVNARAASRARARVRRRPTCSRATPARRGRAGALPDRHRRARGRRTCRPRRAAGVPSRGVRRRERDRFRALADDAASLVRRLHPHQRRSASRAGRRGDLAPRAARPATSTARRTRRWYCARLRGVPRRRRAPSTTRRSSGSRRRTGSSGSRATRGQIRDADPERRAAHRAATSARNEVLGVPRGRGPRRQRLAAARPRRRLGHPGARRSRPARLRVVRRARSNYVSARRARRGGRAGVVRGGT